MAELMAVQNKFTNACSFRFSTGVFVFVCFTYLGPVCLLCVFLCVLHIFSLFVLNCQYSVPVSGKTCLQNDLKYQAYVLSEAQNYSLTVCGDSFSYAVIMVLCLLRETMSGGMAKRRTIMCSSWTCSVLHLKIFSTSATGGLQ